MEFIINNLIKVHPMALLHPQCVSASDNRRIRQLEPMCPRHLWKFQKGRRAIKARTLRETCPPQRVRNRDPH
jgi:hypothetical protein